MKQILKVILVILILNALIFNGCKKKEEEKVVLSEKTRLPEENPNLKNVVLSGDTLYLIYEPGAEKPTFKPGDIVVGATGEGYLKRVISSVTRGDTVSLFTEQACLTDAIKKCEVETTFTLMPEEKKMGKLKIDTTFIDEKGRKYFIKILSDEFLVEPLPQTKEFKKTFTNLRIEIRDPFNNLAAFFACDTVAITKSINPDIKIEIENFEFKEFRFIINTTDKINFKGVQIGLLSSINKEIEKMLIPPIPLGKVVIMAGLVPIVFTFELELYRGAEMNLQVDGSLEILNNVDFTSTFSVGGKYTNGSWTPVNEGTASGDADFICSPSFSVDADCKGFLKGGISTKIYGVAGPYLYLKPYQYDQLIYPPFDFRLGIGLGAGLGFKVKILSWKLADFNWTFADFKKELIHSTTPPPNNPPNTPQTPSGPSSGQVNVSYNFTTSTTDPDGDSVSYQFDWGDGFQSSWSSFVPSGTSITMAKSWSNPGTYYVKARAKDKKGAISFWSDNHQIVIESLGGNWHCVTDSAPWRRRWGHASVIFNNRMWILGGGYDWANPYNDVWYSTNGRDWHCVSESAGWAPRYEHTAVVFDNKIWIMGGRTYNQKALNDVWCSEDGINWIKVMDSAPWLPRRSHGSIVFDNKIWIMGGRDDRRDIDYNDVWFSINGRDWIKAADSAGWSRRHQFSLSIFDNKIWLFGGVYTLRGYGKNDVWYTTDGINWIQASSNAQWSKRWGFPCIVFNNKIWILGGLEIGWRPLNDIWTSADGINWTLLGNAEWPSRSDHASIIYNSKIWLIGGGNIRGQGMNDIWIWP